MIRRWLYGKQEPLETPPAASVPSYDLRGDGDLALMVLESLPDAVIIANTAGQIVYANKQATLLFGYAVSELIGVSVEMLLPPKFHEMHVEHRADYAQNPQPRIMGVGRELFGQHRDGREVPVGVNLAPIVVPGRGTLTVATVRRRL